MSTHLTHWDSIFLAWATRMMRLSIFVYEKKNLVSVSCVLVHPGAASCATKRPVLFAV